MGEGLGEGGIGEGSYMVPDLATEVRVGRGFRKCIVVEVGFAQPLGEARARAVEWLYPGGVGGEGGEVHSVVIIDLKEIPRVYTDNVTGRKMSKRQVAKVAAAWPSDWLHGGEGEVEMRSEEWFARQLETTMRDAGEEGVGRFVRGVKREMGRWMVGRDDVWDEEAEGDEQGGGGAGGGGLVPRLVERLDAHVYLYGRKGEGGGGGYQGEGKGGGGGWGWG